MKLLPHEKIIEEHEYCVLTDKAIIQEKESFFGNLHYTEIPISKIDSISRTYIFHKIFLLLGLFFMLFASYNYIQDNSESLVLYSIVLSGISFFLYFLTAKKELVINSGNEAIFEEAKGASKFVYRLREQVYK